MESRPLDGPLMVTMLVRGILLAFPGFLCSRCLKFDFHRIMLINGAEPERMLHHCWPEGNETGNGRRNWISFASFVATKEETMEEQLAELEIIILAFLQSLNNRDFYLVIGEYTLFCFFMHYVGEDKSFS